MSDWFCEIPLHWVGRTSHLKASAFRNCLSLLAALCLAFVAHNVDAAGQACSSIRYSLPSSPGSEIVFNFDRAYSCGIYANGDWWVSAGNNQPVRIVSILPAAENGLHGFEINPSSRSSQGFDRRIAGYSELLTPILPIKLSGSASIVKAVSAASGDLRCKSCLQYAAVLTVTAEPENNSLAMFRPGYFGNRKSSFSVDSVRPDKLPRIPISCCSAAKAMSLNDLAARFKGVQLDHLVGWPGRGLHPLDNMPDYGAFIARDTAVSALRFLLDDFDMNQAAHRAALVNYLQMSIDLLSMAENGVVWPADGGHGNGRKLPLLLGGYFFDNDRFYGAMNKTTFSEDEQIYFSAVSGRALFGRPCEDKLYWMQIRQGKGPKDCRDPYGYIDGGGQDVGNAYQLCCTAMPWKYAALVVRLLNLERRWGNDAFLQYVDRWVAHGAWAFPDPCAAFNGNVADYGIAYGKRNIGGCVAGRGRFVEMHGANKGKGHYGNQFGDQLWQWHRPAEQ